MAVKHGAVGNHNWLYRIPTIAGIEMPETESEEPANCLPHQADMPYLLVDLSPHIGHAYLEYIYALLGRH